MLLASLHTSSGNAWRRARGAESRCRPCRPLAGLPEMPLSPLTQADPLEQLPRQSVCSVLFAPPRLDHPNRQAALRGQFPASLSLEDQLCGQTPPSPPAHAHALSVSAPPGQFLVLSHAREIKSQPWYLYAICP